MLTRPDLTWYASIAPFCLWDANATVRKRDWVYLAPRGHADEWLKEVPRQFFGCEPQLQHWYDSYKDMAERVTMFGPSGVTGSNQKLERYRSSRWPALWTERARYGGDDQLEVTHIPAALTRTGRSDQLVEASAGRRCGWIGT